MPQGIAIRVPAIRQKKLQVKLPINWYIFEYIIISPFDCLNFNISHENEY